MPRRKSDSPRTEQVLLRLSRRHLEILEAAAFTTRAESPNAYAHEKLTDHLERMAVDYLVRAAMAVRAEQDRRSGVVAGTIGISPRAASDAPVAGNADSSAS